MIKIYYRFLVILILSMKAAYGSLDDLENKLRRQEAVQLRWDNIEGSPFWVSGPHPTYDLPLGLHLVTLSTHEPVVVRLTKEAYLRIHNPFGCLKPNDIDVLVSNGSGLFVSQDVFLSGRDLILPPLHFGGEVVQLRLKKESKACTKTIALFVSRYEPPAPMAPYRTLLDTCAEKEILLSHTTGVPEQSDLHFFNKLNSLKSTTVQVEGPVRLNLVTYIDYGTLDTTYPFMYRMNVCMDGHQYHTAEYIARPDDGKVYYEAFIPHLLSYPNINPIEIPAGIHQLVLTSNANVFFQLQELENPGYLLPCINSPNLENRPLPPNKTALELTQKEVKELIQFKNCSKLPPSRIEQLAIKIGKDNVWQTNGPQSVYLLEELSQKRPDALDLKAARDKTDGLFTFYRDLLPIKNVKQSPQKFAWAIDWNLRDPRDEDKPTFVLASQKDSLLDYLIGGFFLTTGQSQRDALVYALPKRTSPGYLRVLVNQTCLKNPRTLWIQYNQEKPFKLVIAPHQDLCLEAYKPTHGLTGLSLLQDPQNTLGGLFNARHNPGPLFPVGSSEIPLPACVEQVRVWEVCKDEQPLEVALQYQASNPYRLEQPMMVTELKRIQDSERLFFEALEFVLTRTEKGAPDLDSNAFWGQLKGHPQACKQSVAELYNHWLKLLRLLTFRHQKLIEGYAKVDPLFVSPTGQKAQSSMDTKSAETFAKKGQDLEAFQAWTHLLHSSNQEMWRKAHIGRIKALQKLGESYLLERYLKSIFLHTQDEILKDIAFKELSRFYQDKNDYFALEGVLTERFLKTQNAENLKFLSEVLLKDNNEAIAIDLAHVINAKQHRPDSTLIFAAIKSNRARNGERLGEKTETREEVLFWNAQLDQINGNYEEALSKFNQAGPKGAVWRDHLVQGLTLQRRLFACDIGSRLSAIEDWILWSQNQPGPRIWQPANYLVNNFSQAASLYSEIINGYFPVYIADPQKPVQLKLIGPALVQFQVRVVFKKEVPIPYQGWVEIKDNGKSLHYPIAYTYPSEGLDVIGHEGKAGIREQYQISVGPGEHIVEVLPQNTEIIVEPFIEVPVLPLAVLPPVTHESLALILTEGTLNNRGGNDLEVNVLQNGDLLSVFNTVSTNPCLFQTNPQTNSRLFTLALTGLAKSEKIKPYPLSPQDQETYALSQILWDYEKKPSEKLLAEAQKHWMANREDPNLSRLWGRFTQLSLWTPIDTPQKSAGIRSLPQVESWHPDAPETILRKDLIEEDAEDYVLTENSHLVFQFYNEKPTHVKIISELAKIETDDLGTVSWSYQIDDGKTKTTHLLPSKRSNTQEILIPQGEHSLKFLVEKPVRDTFIKLKLSERSDQKTPWIPLKIDEKKDYLLATNNEPVVVDVEGPAWIRVDEWVNGQIIHKDYNLGKGQQKLTLKPSGSQQESLFRVFRRIARAPELISPRIPSTPQYATVKETPLSFCEFEQPNPICGKEVLPLGGQEDGTWSFTNSVNRVLGFAQNSLDGIIFRPDVGLDKVDKYVEQRVTYRYFDEINRMYWRGDALVRERSTKPTVGALGEVYYSPIDLPITFWGAGSAYAQNYHISAQPLPPNGRAPVITAPMVQHLRSGTIIGGIRHKLVFTEKADQKVNLSILKRKVHFKKVPNFLPFNPNAVIPHLPDRDVFSTYLATHPRALNFEYAFYYRPWQDNRLRAEFLAISNPRFKLLSPDSVTGRWGMDQLIGPFILSADYAVTHFYRNMKQSNLVPNSPQTLLTEIRPFSYNRNIIHGALTWNHWLPNHTRLECKFDVGHVFDSQLPVIPIINSKGVLQPNRPGIKQKGVKQWVGFVSFTWHFGNGRDFRDFYPEDILFKEIRERHLPPVQIPCKGASQ